MKNPPGFPAVSIGCCTIPSSIRGGIDPQPPVGLLPGAARGQLVALDQLVLQPADVRVLGRQLHHRIRRLGAAIPSSVSCRADSVGSGVSSWYIRPSAFLICVMVLLFKTWIGIPSASASFKGESFRR